MLKKIYFAFFIFIIFISCQKREALFLTDPIYNELIFSEKKSTPKIIDRFFERPTMETDSSNSKAFYKYAKKNRYKTNIVLTPGGNVIPDIKHYISENPSDVVILSPLLNKRIDNLSESFSDRIFFLIDTVQTFSADNVVLGLGDRRDCFAKLGEEVAGYVEKGLKVSCVFFQDSVNRQKEKEVFFEEFDKNKNISRTDIIVEDLYTFDNKGFADEFVRNSQGLGIDLFVLFAGSYNAEIIFLLKENFQPIVITEDFDPYYSLFYNNVWKTVNNDYAQIYSDFFSSKFDFPKKEKIKKEKRKKQKLEDEEEIEEDIVEEKKHAKILDLENNVLQQKSKIQIVSKSANPEILIRVYKENEKLEKEKFEQEKTKENIYSNYKPKKQNIEDYFLFDYKKDKKYW